MQVFVFVFVVVVAIVVVEIFAVSFYVCTSYDNEESGGARVYVLVCIRVCESLAYVETS